MSSHVVLVAAVSVIGCATVLKPVIENKKRKIDSLTDDRSVGLNIQYTEEMGVGSGFFILMRPKCLCKLLLGDRTIHEGPYRNPIY